MKRTLEVARSKPSVVKRYKADPGTTNKENQLYFLVISWQEGFRISCVLELWLHWIGEYISINPVTGDVGGYVEEILPGWLLLQIGRGLASMPDDVYIDKRTKRRKFTSVALINLLRRKSPAGYLVDELSYERWLQVIGYQDKHFKAFIHPEGDEMEEEKKQMVKGSTYQLLNLSQIQPGINSPYRWWIPLDLNKMCYFL